MAISKKALAAIEKRVAQYKLYIRFMAVGPHGLTQKELKELLHSGLINYKGKIRTPIAEAYFKTHGQVIKDKGQANKSYGEGALNFLDRMMDRYAGKAVDQLKTNILSTIEGTLKPFDDHEGTPIYEALQDKDLHKKNLRGLLRDQVQNWEGRWRTIVDTELNRAANWGAMDAIITNNKTKTSDQIYVYKIGNKPDKGSCKICSKFWFLEDGATPRVYKLSELVANGTNMGKKQKDWLPTVDSTHPNESHTLHELPDGWGFNGSFHPEYIGLDHIEFNKQRGIAKP